MGKKNKKFAKRKKGAKSAPVVSNAQSKAPATEEVIEPISHEEDKEPIETKPDPYDTDQYEYIKKDIKKILIIITLVIILLFVTYYLNLKTSLFTTLGDWVYDVLNINIE